MSVSKILKKYGICKTRGENSRDERRVSYTASIGIVDNVVHVNGYYRG